MMDDIFDDLIMEGVVVVYLDDILIFMETLKDTGGSLRELGSCSGKTTSSLKPRSASSKRQKWSTSV